ncbi:transposase [Hymenobacter elongatus]|uniref:Transposase n=1 Tax=Hymenobacter elongatus TaxID=877208 RepID=A0A4Z0PDV7_9BACT|nr:transposase [Hymenobacter elongatus]
MYQALIRFPNSLTCDILRFLRGPFLRQRLRELAQVRVRYGSQRLYVLLRREGWPDNHKRVHRLYCLEGLNLRSKRPRRNRAAAHRLARLQLGHLHQSWSMDFVADNLFDGRKIRALTIVDNFSRQCLVLSQGSFSNKKADWSLLLNGKTTHSIRPVVG